MDLFVGCLKRNTTVLVVQLWYEMKLHPSAAQKKAEPTYHCIPLKA